MVELDHDKSLVLIQTFHATILHWNLFFVIMRKDY